MANKPKVEVIRESNTGRNERFRDTRTGNEMTRKDWKHEWVCHRCGRKRPIPLPPMFTVFMCRKCEHLLYVEEDEDFPQKLGKIAAKSCTCCGEQEEGLWRLLGRAEGFEGTVFTEESDED